MWIGWPTASLAITCGAIGLLVYLPYLRALDFAPPAAVVLMWNLSPVLVVVFAWTVLGERLIRLDYLAIVLLVVGSVLAAHRPGTRTHTWSRALPWMVLASVMYAVEVTLEKAVFERTTFAAGFGWISASVLVTTFGVLIIRPRSRRALVRAVRERTPILVGNELLDLAAVAARARATSLGSVSLVNAIGGLQPIAVILFTMIGSMFRIRGVRMPDRRELLRIMVATILAAIGLGFIRSFD